jgi:hypothetical protein
VTGALVILWFITCVGVIAYGVSNNAVHVLELPRWSSLAIVGVGFTMLMAMFALGLYAEVADVPWSQNPSRQGGD